MYFCNPNLSVLQILEMGNKIFLQNEIRITSNKGPRLEMNANTFSLKMNVCVNQKEAFPIITS